MSLEDSSVATHGNRISGASSQMTATMPEGSPKELIRPQRDDQPGVLSPHGLGWLNPYRRLSILPFGRVSALLASFLLVVVLPSIATGGYYFLIAAPQFAAEARFVIRSADTGSQGDTLDSNGASAAVAFSPAAQNAYIIASYIRSRAIVDDIRSLVDLRQVFRRPEADFIAQLNQDATEEQLVDYWNSMVHGYVDGPSAIVTVEVRAFTPADALAIANAIDVLSERLVNQVSEHARNDITRAAEEEVGRADRRVRFALQELENARDRDGIIDPVKAAADTSKLIMQLMEDKIRLESDTYLISRSLNKNAPAVRQSSDRLKILTDQIASLRASLASDAGGSKTISGALRRFEELEVQRQMSEKLLSLAEDGLERAKIRAERQNVYLLLFAVPMLPNKALYPRRLAYTAVILAALFVLWSIGAFTWLAIEDHRD
jgi:capsular polysaccharide transport system permease protein